MTNSNNTNPHYRFQMSLTDQMRQSVNLWMLTNRVKSSYFWHDERVLDRAFNARKGSLESRFLHLVHIPCDDDLIATQFKIEFSDYIITVETI